MDLASKVVAVATLAAEAGSADSGVGAAEELPVWAVAVITLAAVLAALCAACVLCCVGLRRCLGGCME